MRVELNGLGRLGRATGAIIGLAVGILFAQDVQAEAPDGGSAAPEVAPNAPPAVPAKAPLKRLERTRVTLPSGTFEGDIEGAAITAHVRIVVVNHLMIGAELKLGDGRTLALEPQGLAGDVLVSLALKAPAESAGAGATGSKDFIRLRGVFDDLDAASGRWDGVLAGKKGDGAWSVGRR